ncbi:MAG: glycosyltransferase family 39 protein [Candidatus Omnitrophota bacterium]|jgi:hypothetical protein
MADSDAKRSFLRHALILTGGTTFLWHVYTLHPGHNWGGDFAQYILHARNILAGREYSSGIMIDNPVLFPPGFPLLLAPMIRFFGINFKFLKIWNVVFWYGTMVLLYDQFRRSFGEAIAVLSVLFFIVNAYFFSFKQNILSDIPFVFFVWAALAAFSLYERQREEGQKRKAMITLALAAILTLGAFCIRAAGAALVGAIIYYFAVIRKDVLPAGILLAAFLACVIILASTIGSLPGDLQVLREQPAAAVRAFAANFPLITKSLWIACFPIETRIMRALYLGMAPLLNGAAAVFYIGLCVSFARKSLAKTLTLPEAFCFFYGGMLFVLSAFDNAPWEFIRFLLPVWGFLIFFLIRAAISVGESISPRRPLQDTILRFVKVGLVMMIMVNAGTIALTCRRQDDVLLRKENQELFSWIRKNVPPEEHYIFWHPRPLALMTGRIGTDRWNHPSQQGRLAQRIAELNIRFLFLDRTVDADLLAAMDAGFFPADEIWQNSQYRVFRVKR